LAGLAGLADVSGLLGKSIALAIAEKPPRLNREFLIKTVFLKKSSETGTNRHKPGQTGPKPETNPLFHGLQPLFHRFKPPFHRLKPFSHRLRPFSHGLKPLFHCL